MTNEEIQRTMEFILAGQARFDARMEKDEARIARLEDAFVTLVELARITDERQDKTDQRVDTFEEKLSALAEAQRVSETKLRVLAEAETRLVARTEKDAARIARLDAAFVTLVEVARITDERQDKTDQRVDRSDERLGLTMSLTDAKLAELGQRLNALIDVVERYITKGNNGTPQV